MSFFVNNNRVGGYGSPVPSNPVHSKYYLSYDITELIKTGDNVFCAKVHYLGGDGQNYVNGLPGFFLQSDIIFEDNSTMSIITDKSWKVTENTAYTSGTPFQQNRRISAIEDYNLNKEPEDWLLLDFNDNSWGNTVISTINQENWQLKKQTVPEGIVEELLTPELSGIQEIGLQVFDVGKVLTGWPIISLKGEKDITIRMRYSEDMDAEGRVKHNVCNEESHHYYDQYTMKGLDEEVWAPDFSYKAFRYIEVSGYPQLISNQDISVAAVHTGLDYQGHFDSSNKLLNKIYQSCIQTQKNNMLGQLVDCPHREQAQYLADTELQAETLTYNFEPFTTFELLKKTLQDFQDGQMEDGRFPFVYPANIEHPDFNLIIPEWELHFCILLWKLYWIYGDKSVLKKYYKTVKRMLNYYWQIRDPKIGLIPKADGWHISDWPYPNIDHSGEFLTVQNCKFYFCLKIMAKIADILKFNDDRNMYNKWSSLIKGEIREYLYDSEKQRFMDSYQSAQSHQGTNVLGLSYGLVPAGDKQDLLKNIVKQGFDCKTLLSLPLLQVLFENGEEDTAYEIINSKQYPGWGYMMAQGSKTIWEGFDDIESHSHAWNAYPARLFVQYIVGIRAVMPGFEKVEIAPYIPSDMAFAEGNVPTVGGEIKVKWEKGNSGFTLDVFIPDNMTAIIKIPKLDFSQVCICISDQIIWKDSQFYSQFENISFCEETSTAIVLSVDCGKYKFKLT